MNRTVARMALSAGLAAVAVAGGVQAAASADAAAAGARHMMATVHVEKLSVGSVLVDGAGRTLYVFGPDAHKRPTCTGSCAAVWPPLLVRHKPIAGMGVKKSLLGSVRTASGKLQVTYDHWPLYTFVEDTAPGEAHGQGVRSFGGTWSTIDASGSSLVAVASASGHSTSSTTAGTSGSGSGSGW